MSRSKLPSLKELVSDVTDSQIHKPAPVKSRKKKIDCGKTNSRGMLSYVWATNHLGDRRLGDR